MLRTLLLALLLGSASACQLATSQPPMSPVPVAGFVTDLPAFERFIASRPTAEAFRAAYPDVQLVMPGDITTKEFRSNNSRYYAAFDAEGRITGGRFM